MNCTLSPEVYRWQHEGGWKTGRLVKLEEFAVRSGSGLINPRYLDAASQVLVFDPLAEAPGLSFVQWGNLELYDRGP